jgi:hypothetical protein
MQEVLGRNNCLGTSFHYMLSIWYDRDCIENITSNNFWLKCYMRLKTIIVDSKEVAVFRQRLSKHICAAASIHDHTENTTSNSSAVIACTVVAAGMYFFSHCQFFLFWKNKRGGLWDHLAVCVSAYNPWLPKAAIIETEEIAVTISYKHLWHVTWRLKAGTLQSEMHHRDGQC